MDSAPWPAWRGPSSSRAAQVPRDVPARGHGGVERGHGEREGAQNYSSSEEVKKTDENLSISVVAQ